MLIDTDIIARHQVRGRQSTTALDVIGHHDPVVFCDGSEVALHHVLRNQVDETFCRALRDGHQWLLLDLRPMHTSIERDIKRAHWHDTPGIVFYSLRLAYPCAAVFMERARLCAEARWPQEALC